MCTLLENNGWYLLFLPLFFEDLENFTGIEASHNMPFITCAAAIMRDAMDLNIFVMPCAFDDVNHFVRFVESGVFDEMCVPVYSSDEAPSKL